MRSCHPKSYPIALQVLCWLAVLSLAAVATSAQTFPDPPDGTYEFTSAQSGPWHSPATWGTVSTIPATGDDILIQDGHRVIIQREETARHRFIRVEGEMRLWIHGNTKLLVETLYVFGDGRGGANEGIFMIGAVNNPVKAGFRAQVIFTSSGAFDLTWDSKQASRGLISDGIIRLFGLPKTHVIESPQNFFAGADHFLIEPPFGGWQEKDELVIAGTYFQRVNNPSVTSSQDERVTVIFQGGDTFEFDPKLSYDHLSVGNRPFHIVNLTRNLILSSETTTLARDRGHVMLRHADVHIENVAFVNLGRTDKRIPLDDKVITVIKNGAGTPIDYDITTPAPSAIQNPRGRYAVHFHLNGIQPQMTNPPSKVYGSVVDGTIGWGFVNHSSHVDFQRNVAYNFAGAGFVTELGDELGNFYDNVAIRGTGNGEYRKDRVVFQNFARPQPLSDFAFGGDGFWFQGPALRVKNNIANGCDGAGMIWFTTGAPDVAQEYPENGYTHNRYSHFPRTALDDVYGIGHGLLPRYWIHSVTDEKLVISDLPILELENFTAYGNLVGFRLRFNNHNNVAWYTEDAFDYHLDIVPVCGGNRQCAVRNRQALDQMTLWNNEQAFRMRYATNSDWSDVDAISRLAYDNLNPFHGHDGAEIRHALESQTFTDLAIDGYPIAGWIQSDVDDDVRPEITFTPNPPAYSNYANFDTWIRATADPLYIPCTPPTSLQVTTISSNAATVSWQAGTNNTRYVVRYQAQNEQPWEFLVEKTTTAKLTGLSSGTAYDVEVVAGCSQSGDERNVSVWSAKLTFTTL